MTLALFAVDLVGGPCDGERLMLAVGTVRYRAAALTDLLGASTRPTDIPPLLHAGNCELDASAQAGAPITSDRLTFFRWSGWA